MNHSRKLSAASLAAFAFLGACNSEPEILSTRNDPQAAALANRPAVQLPPSISASRIYRCADNSVVYIDFYGTESAAIRADESGTPVRLVKASEDAAYTGEGFTVSENAEVIQLTKPGGSAQRCRGTSRT